jgi:hypothetical protein
VIQFREFLSDGTYNIKLEAIESGSEIKGFRPRCEAY